MKRLTLWLLMISWAGVLSAQMKPSRGLLKTDDKKEDVTSTDDVNAGDTPDVTDDERDLSTVGSTSGADRMKPDSPGSSDVKPRTASGMAGRVLGRQVNLSDTTSNKIKTLNFGDPFVMDASELQGLDKRFREVVLYVNEYPVEDIEVLSVNPFTKKVTFLPERTSQLANVLPNVFIRTVPLELRVGYKDGFYSRKPVYVKLDQYDQNYFIGGMFFILTALAVLIWLAAKSSILRDPLREWDPNWRKKPRSEQPHFSLTRTQLAWWTMVVFASFVFLFIVRRELVMNPQALVLMGIALSTSGVSSLMDNPTGDAPPQARIIHRSFFLDILSDGNGVSITRFQTVLFNIIIGLAFLIHVVTKLEMPEFDSSILGLLGLSSAGFAALKTMEKKQSAPALIADAAAESAVATVPPPADGGGGK